MSAVGAVTGGPVVVVGSVNVDLVLRSRRLPEPGETVADAAILEALGGKGANQAVAAARMGAPVTLVARVGDDRAGADALATLRAHGVDTATCRTVPVPTGRAAVLVDADGRNAISVGPGANAELPAPEVGEGWPDGARVVLTQLEIPPAAAAAAIALARERGAISCLNVTPASRCGEVGERPDVLIANRGEARELSGGADGTAEALADAVADRLGVHAVVVTDGEHGAAARWGEERLRVPAPRVAARDTTGAGDAFAGVLAAGLAEEVPFALALRRACAAGALACLSAGAVPAMPTREAVLGQVERAGKNR